MTRIGIVGSEAAKFTVETELRAREAIRDMLGPGDVVISGHSPLGGIDIWAIQEAQELGLETVEHPPAVQRWEGGYRERNLQIARDSDVVVCITLKRLPDRFRGMRFEGGCYHCKTPPDHHVKSGGCWTAKEARKLGKRSVLVVIDDEPMPPPDPTTRRIMALEEATVQAGFWDTDARDDGS